MLLLFTLVFSALAPPPAPTTFTSPEFVAGKQTAIACEFHTPFTPTGDTSWTVELSFADGAARW